MEEDKKLYEKFLNGDKNSFEKLVLKYKKNLIYFISRYVKNIDVAEDIFQEVIVFILEKKDYYNFDYSFKTYIYMIAKSKALDYAKKEKRTESLEDLKIDFEDTKLLEEIILTKERHDKIQTVMKKMSTEYQLVIYLTQIEGLSYKETALILDKTESKIKALAFNARKKLKKLLIKENVIEVRNKKIIILISTILFVAATITCATYADEIVEFVKGFFGANVSEGVNTAVENGFYAEVETNTQSSEGIDISVESFIIDDYNLAMNFLITLDERYDVNEMLNSSIWLEDLRVIDENNKVVFSTNYNLPRNPNERFEPEYWNGFSMHTEKVGENQLRMYVTSSGSVQTFPRSEKLYISFKRIATRRSPKDGSYLENGNENRIIYLGNWKFEAEVPENMQKRESSSYKAVKCNEHGIDLSTIEAKLSNTAFKLNIPEIKTDKVDYEKLHESNRNPKSIYDRMALQKEYVETSDGRKYESDPKSDGDSGYGLSSENTIIHYHQTFSLTSYEATDKLTVHIFTNKGEEIIIWFEK